MTPELKKELIVGIVSSISTAVFTGIPAIMLVWWTWRRDQERLVIQKLVSRVDKFSGGTEIEHDNFGPTLDILIRNRSLFPVHVSAAGFDIDGEIIVLTSPLLPVRMKPNPDPQSNRPWIPDNSADVWEIASQASTRVHVNPADRPRIAKALYSAAEKRNVTIEELLGGPNVRALAASEAGNEFSSLTLFARIRGAFKRALVAQE